MLRRWNELAHEHWPAIQDLRAAGVSEHRIQALYPSKDATSDYVVKLSSMLTDPQAFDSLHKRFKADRKLLRSSQTGWSLWPQVTSEGLTPPSEMIYFGTAQTAEVVELLHVLYPRKFKRWPTSAHEFASALLVLPALLQIISERGAREMARFTLGANREATHFTFDQLSEDVEFVLEHLHRTQA